MERVGTILACVGLAVMLAALGWLVGRKTAGRKPVESVTVTDTLWVAVHDTCWQEVAVNVLRTDTVRLAYVPDFAVSGTSAVSNGYENGISGTHTDTLIVHDSVYVEIPIETHTFTGDHWRVTAHGYRVGLDDVWFDRQVIMARTTETRYADKRWRFSVGAQIGYGYTVHGGSPYVGIGVGFGYTF